MLPLLAGDLRRGLGVLGWRKAPPVANRHKIPILSRARQRRGVPPALASRPKQTPFGRSAAVVEPLKLVPQAFTGSLWLALVVPAARRRQHTRPIYPTASPLLLEGKVETGGVLKEQSRPFLSVRIVLLSLIRLAYRLNLFN